MKKVGDLFADLGFRPDASDSVKRAFVENLVRAAGVSERVDSRAKQIARDAELKPKPRTAASAAISATTPAPSQQLSFNFDELNSDKSLVSIETKRRSS